MKPAVVVDIGNTRIKWGRCDADAVADMVSLPPNDPAAWEAQAQRWSLPASTAWAVASVHRARAEALIQWLRDRGREVLALEHAAQLPLVVRVDNPDHVGIDRLLNAVAARHGRPPKGRRRKNAPVVIIDAGSAITVDLIDATGVFRGGAILPGLRLMAQALHDYTDLLPVVEISEAPADLGASTPAAMRAGIFNAAVGGIALLVASYKSQGTQEPDVFVTGGDGALLQKSGLAAFANLWPNMTLEGIRISAEAQA